MALISGLMLLAFTPQPLLPTVSTPQYSPQRLPSITASADYDAATLADCVKDARLRPMALTGIPPFMGVLGAKEPQPSKTFGSLRRLTHGALLPRDMRNLISASDRLILNFVLEFLEEREKAGELCNVSTHISGGYVRDLLLGRTSGDLDLALCLRECPEDVTIGTIIGGMPAFALRRPELAIEAVEIVTALSGAARGKSIDAAAVRMRLDDEWRVVDFMPTIGQERYDEGDRVPMRDGRGTLEEDCLRRDLTIGSMLLHVTPLRRRDGGGVGSNGLDGASNRNRPEPFSERERLAEQLVERMRREGPPPELGGGSLEDVATADLEMYVDDVLDGCVAAAASAVSLHFRLLDFHGGIEDLRSRTLRAPTPRQLSLDQMRSEVLRCVRDPDEARELTSALEAGIVHAPDAIRKLEEQAEKATRAAAAFESQAEAALWKATAAEAVEAADAAVAAEVQAVWWIKTLRDDPLRLVRALRFSAALQFRIHPSFWLAVPFAVDALATKVSGARKLTELRKIAAAGVPALLDFFELAFTRLPRFGDDVAFGDALFGGPSTAGSERLSVAMGFDAQRMRTAASALPTNVGNDARVGAVLACALLSSDLKRCVRRSSDGAVDDDEDDDDDYSPCDALDDMMEGTGGTPDAVDKRAAAAAAISFDEVERACEGLCASSAMRQSAAEPLALVRQLVSRRVQPPPPLPCERLFASATAQEHADGSRTFAICSAEHFAALTHTWELLKLDPALSQRQLEVGPELVLALIQMRCDPSTVLAFAEQLETLRKPGPTINGRAVAELTQVPPHLRSHVISRLHVLTRLRGEEPELDSAKAIEAYLETACGGLLTRLCAEWWEDEDAGEGWEGQRLRAGYSKREVSERDAARRDWSPML